MTNQVFRSLNIKPSTINEADRSVEVVWTSGASVRRYDMNGEYNEVLVVSEEAVNLDRLNAGAPVLNTHRSWGVEDILGVVDSAWLRNGKGYARVRFSDRPEADAVWRDVVAGIIRNLSVGYEIEGFEEITDENGERTLRVNNWTPVELSVVPVPADAGAQFRSSEVTNTSEVKEENQNAAIDEEKSEIDEQTVATPDASESNSVETETQVEDVSGEKEVTSTEVSDAPAGDIAPVIEQDSAVRVASNHAAIVRACVSHGVAHLAADFIESNMNIDAVNARVAAMSEIRTLCKRAGKADKAESFIQENIDIHEVRKRLLEEMLEEDNKTEIRSRFVNDVKPKERVNDALSPASIYQKLGKRGQ